jgi:hypothetical protein
MTFAAARNQVNGGCQPCSDHGSTRRSRNVSAAALRDAYLTNQKLREGNV